MWVWAWVEQGRLLEEGHTVTLTYSLICSLSLSLLFRSLHFSLYRYITSLIVISFNTPLSLVSSVCFPFFSHFVLHFSALYLPPLSLSFPPLFSTSFMLLRRHLSFSSPPRFAVGEGSRELRCNDGLLNICVVTACLHAYMSSSLACLLRSSFFGLCFLFGVCLSVRPCFYPFVCLFVFPCLSVCLSPFIFVCVLLIFCARF